MSNTNPVPNSGEILNQRVAKAAEAMKVTEGAVWSMLGKIGIERDDVDALSIIEADTTDFRRMLQLLGNDLVPEGVKPARLELGFAILKGPGAAKPKADDVASVLREHVAQLRPVSQYKDRELVERYGPDATTDVVDELRKRSSDRPFVVFQEGSESVDVDNSVLMLRIARQQETKSSHVLTTPEGNKAVRLYRVGEFPSFWVEESPIHPDIILVDGYCEKCGDTWKEISMFDRIIVRIAKDAGFVGSSKADVAALIERVRTEGAKHLLKIPGVKLRYDELVKEDDLPLLRRKIGASRSGAKDPLFIHRSY
jgi:hypothetical protein